MNLYIRMLIWLIKWPFLKKLGILDTSSLCFHVLPNDLDFNMHMNNGRYLTIMDIGRVDLMARCGVFVKAIKQNYGPVLASVQIRYRLSLQPFQKYRLETRMVCWDEKWAYMEQRFIVVNGKKAGAVAAIAMLKGSFYDTRNKNTVPPNDILLMWGQDIPSSPPMPEYFQKWIEAEQALQIQTAV